jgi:hypothetical protein
MEAIALVSLLSLQLQAEVFGQFVGHIEPEASFPGDKPGDAGSVNRRILFDC